SGPCGSRGACSWSCPARSLALPLLVPLALVHHGEDPGDVLSDLAQPVRVVELAGDVLEPEVEQLLFGLGQLGGQLVAVQVGQLTCLHGHHSASARFTNLHFMGSLWAARRIASWAVASGTPDSSNITRPGRTTATHHSGEPLPEPMSVSAGCLVHRLVGEDVDPDLAPTLDVAGHGDTGGLDLAVGDPGRLEGLEAVVAEG